MDDAYNIIGDLAHEVPEAADAVLAWRRDRTCKLVHAAHDRDRKAGLDAERESVVARHQAQDQSR